MRSPLCKSIEKLRCSCWCSSCSCLPFLVVRRLFQSIEVYIKDRINWRSLLNTLPSESKCISINIVYDVVRRTPLCFDDIKFYWEMVKIFFDVIFVIVILVPLDGAVSLLCRYLKRTTGKWVKVTILKRMPTNSKILNWSATVAIFQITSYTFIVMWVPHALR